MQSTKEAAEFKDLVLGRFLADMQEISWKQALLEHNTFLRVAKPPEDMLEALTERFLLDELHVKDICNPAHPPQYTQLQNGGMHIILRFPLEQSEGGDTREVTSVSLLVDHKMCVLIWPSERFHYFSDHDLIGLSVDECACKIIHLLVDYLLRRVYTLREEMDEFEDECLADFGNADLGRLLLMRKEFALLARYAGTNAITIEKLRMNTVYRENLLLVDAHEHMQRAAAIAESRSEHALSVMQAVQSLLSQRLNEVLTFLAVITVILTPMGIIAGIFGMNFTNMDILKSPNGFTLAIGGMLLLGITLAVIFKVRKWW